ncbi:MAG: hypothetical protein COX39_02400 [Candidatus Nealsonbacteria bacterium CG23_combo_of_CG06-09_8_20_14_all_40_13]|uniref:Uncharacterized protein n=1 Tax=Candidatus Nealsonbacteria bacterium CG23_combo_of_CG06-09_8_20_14_all_40_13 TaxID=1974724 RepID=A0A2G9YQN3_9BACT|nr:MAG: hypothetical protein COX39_02400 [Candidatus Nealsonbacteria bacterium CG23_combo_of_CG06-09_8_20_14_all_40_13]
MAKADQGRFYAEMRPITHVATGNDLPPFFCTSSIPRFLAWVRVGKKVLSLLSEVGQMARTGLCTKRMGDKSGRKAILPPVVDAGGNTSDKPVK